MTNEQQLNAKHLYFQTDMSKTQISTMLNIPRRTLHYWIREKNWDRLKKSAAHMPSLLAEKCYHLIAQFTDQLLSENRIMKPITHQEADTLHKLTLTVNKLKNRATLNESMEMFGFFMERVNQKSPELAQAVSPIVEEYISTRGNTYISDFRPENFNDFGLIPAEKPDLTETQLDMADITDWTDANKPQMDIEQLNSIPEESTPSVQSASSGNSGGIIDDVASPAPSGETQGEAPLAHVTSTAPSGEGRGEAPLAHVTSPSPSERVGERSLAQDTPFAAPSLSSSEEVQKASTHKEEPSLFELRKAAAIREASILLAKRRAALAQAAAANEDDLEPQVNSPVKEAA